MPLIAITSSRFIVQYRAEVENIKDKMQKTIFLYINTYLFVCFISSIDYYSNTLNLTYPTILRLIINSCRKIALGIL